jgi:hypothetical protein
VQLAAGAGRDRGPRGDRGDGVAERHHDGVGVGAHEQAVATSGAVMSVTDVAAGAAPVTCPTAEVPCGHTMVAVVWLTGSSGTMPHSSTPAMPATTAISLAMR